jgi:hypothetical protein
MGSEVDSVMFLMVVVWGIFVVMGAVADVLAFDVVPPVGVDKDVDLLDKIIVGIVVVLLDTAVRVLVDVLITDLEEVLGCEVVVVVVVVVVLVVVEVVDFDIVVVVLFVVVFVVVVVVVVVVVELVAKFWMG